MGIKESELMDDEYVVHVMRTHVKTQFFPAVIFISMSAGGSYLAGFFTQREQPFLMWMAIALAVAIAVVGSLVPFINWLAWSITLTSDRLIEQRGVFRRGRRTVLLNRLSDAEYSQTLGERVWGTGTLVVRDLAERKGLTMRNVPRVKETHLILSQLISQTTPAQEVMW